MEEGILIPNMQCGRADVRFNSDGYYGGLYCGIMMDVRLNDRWIPTRIEMGSRGWYLADIQEETIFGLKVRI